jgi:hypothetical protein
MAKRGSLYRCHLFSFSGPETEGVESEWTQDLAPIGDEEVLSGEPVELHVKIDGALHPLKPDAKIRLDILEEDWLLTGGNDDAVLSIVGTGAPRPEDDFPIEERTTVHRLAAPGQEPLAALRAWRTEAGAAAASQILLLEQPGEKTATFHIVAGWIAQRLEDYANSEMNFIVNVDDDFEDQTEQILDVSPDKAPPDDDPSPWHPSAVVRRIFRLLSTSLTDWAVTKDDAAKALALLRSLEPVDLVRTLNMMHENRTWNALAKVMEEAEGPDALAWVNLELSTDVNLGYLVPGDKLFMVSFAGALIPETPDVTLDEYHHFLADYSVPGEVLDPFVHKHGEFRVWINPFELTPEARDRLGPKSLEALVERFSQALEVDRDGGVEVKVIHAASPVLILGRFKLAGLAPVEAANVIARAYAGADILRSPSVALGFKSRGKAYSSHSGVMAQLGAFGHHSTWTPDPNDPIQRMVARLGVYCDYISNARGTDSFTISAILLYHKWIEDHRGKDEFFTTPPEQVWEESLKIAGAPPPPTPLDPWLRLSSYYRAQMDRASQQERPRLEKIWGQYVGWIAKNADDEALLTTTDPVTIYVQFAVQATREEVDAELEKARKKRKEAAEAIDFDLVGRKLDEAIDFTIRRVRHARDPYVLEGVLEEGGIGPFFKDRKGVGYLVMPSEMEKKVRNLIADEYMHDLIERMSIPSAVRALKDRSIEEDFNLWLNDRPEYFRALDEAYTHPYTEAYEFEVELEGWKTAIEVGVSFIPIVGQIVGAIEVVKGTSLMGRSLGPVERGVTAIAILLPCAVKLGKTGVALARASTIARDYNLTAREANVLYRAALPLREGSAGRKLLQGAVDDINAGKRITDRKTIAELEALMKEMGVMEKSTATALGATTGQALTDTALVTDESAARLIRETLGEQSVAYRGLSKEGRDAVRAAIKEAGPDVRRILAAESEQGFLKYKTSLFDRMKTVGMPQQQVDELEKALANMNKERQAALATKVTSITRERILNLGSNETIRAEGDLMKEGLGRRAQRARDAAGKAADQATKERLIANAERLEAEQTRLGQWLDAGSFRLEEFQTIVGKSPALKQVVEKGGEPMLRRLWIQFTSRPPGRPLRVDFERYVEILERHHVGNFGEFETAFRLGETHIILKAPDELVTIPGTDLIAIPRGGGMIHLIDNKALSQAQVDAVDAMVRNLPKNLNADVNELAKLMNDANLPKEFQDAFTRMSAANTEIQTITSGMTKAQIEAPAVQQQITQALAKQNIERVVTNAGGQASDISADLRALGIDMADMN